MSFATSSTRQSLHALCPLSSKQARQGSTLCRSFSTVGFSNGMPVLSGVTQSCRLSWLTKNSALVYEPKCGGGGGGVAGSQPMSSAVHMEPSTLCNVRSNLRKSVTVCDHAVFKINF
jgi:hypothetical protein